MSRACKATDTAVVAALDPRTPLQEQAAAAAVVDASLIQNTRLSILLQIEVARFMAAGNGRRALVDPALLRLSGCSRASMRRPLLRSVSAGLSSWQRPLPGVHDAELRHLAAVIEPQPEVSKMTIDTGLKPEQAYG